MSSSCRLQVLHLSLSSSNLTAHKHRNQASKQSSNKHPSLERGLTYGTSLQVHILKVTNKRQSLILQEKHILYGCLLVLQHLANVVIRFPWSCLARYPYKQEPYCCHVIETQTVQSFSRHARVSEEIPGIFHYLFAGQLSLSSS